MKKNSIKLYEIWKYIIWYILIQSVTSFFLIYSGVIKLNDNETIVGFIIFHDVVLVFSYSMLGTFLSVYLGAFLSSTYSHKELFQKDIFKFKHSFLKVLVDITLKLLITLSALSIRLKDVQELSSIEKLQFIGVLFFFLIFITFIIKSAARSIGIQFMSLLDWIGFALLMPIFFYRTQKDEIINSEISDKAKKVFSGILFTLCTLMFLAIVYAIASVFIMVFSKYIL